MATYSSILPEEFHGQRSLTCYSPWGHNESDTTERLTITNMKEGYLPAGARAVPTGAPLGACVLDTHSQKEKKKKNS